MTTPTKASLIVIDPPGTWYLRHDCDRQMVIRETYRTVTNIYGTHEVADRYVAERWPSGSEHPNLNGWLETDLPRNGWLRQPHGRELPAPVPVRSVG